MKVLKFSGKSLANGKGLENTIDIISRKVNKGESSLFLINSREQKLIASELKANIITIKTLNANVKLYKTYEISNLD